MPEKAYDRMEKGRKEARIGLNSEKEIINLINSDSNFQKALRKCLLALGFKSKKKITAYKDGLKTDIFVIVDGEIGISIKSSTATSFHQLDRRRLEEWASLLGMPDDIFKIMKESILRVARNSRDKFISESDRDKIKDFFGKHLKVVINEIFRKGEQSLKLLMINDKRTGKVYVFGMDDVIDFLFENASNNVTFTKKGIVRLGDFITVQRKGGDGKHISLPKTDWKHPGNQLQFKFSPLKFSEHAEKTNRIRFCIIEY
ncbi:MAG: hypothetical protein Q6352_006185 [Candidatus Freyrarchaeum guaymaensis]